MGQLSTPEALTLRWAEMIQDPTLRNLPSKIELDAAGRIEMSPGSFRHSQLQGYVAGKLTTQLPHGKVLIKLAVLTEMGVRVVDVAWSSAAYIAAYQASTPASKAPEICVDVRSPFDSAIEIRTRARAYLAAGAEEVWIVSTEGTHQVFTAQNEHHESRYPVRLDKLSA